jgi:hypothetical protein
MVERTWSRVVAVLAINRLCAPGSELAIEERWYPATALDDLLEIEEGKINDTRLYRCLDRILPHKKKLEQHLQQRVAFLGYALWVTLKHLLQRRPIVPQPSASGVDHAQPFSPMKALALLSTLQSADIVLPTTDGREIRLGRITEPTTEQKSLLHQLGLDLPERFQLNASGGTWG